MTMKRFLTTVVLGVILAAPWSWPGPASVSAVVTLRVTPAIYPLEAVPGARGEQPITVANDGDEAIEIITGVLPYQDAMGDLSAVEWIEVEPAAFTLSAGESREAMVRVEVPDFLTTGGRYAVVTFSTAGKPSEAGSRASIGAQIGVVILLVIEGEGDLVESAELVNFGPVLEADGRVSFQTLVHNSGNVHLRPQGTITITHEDGSPYGSLEIPQQRIVLPSSRGLLGSQGSLPVEEGSTYKAAVKLTAGEDEVLTGEVVFAPTVGLSVASAGVCENLDRGPTLSTTLRNDGGLGLSPSVRFVVRSVDGNLTGDATAPPAIPVWGESTSEIVADFSERLVTGDYVLTVQVHPVSSPPGGENIVPPFEFEQAFSIGGLEGKGAPLCENPDSA